MSFGFGVGDFLAVLELANKVRQKWTDAPEEYGTMKDETKNVSVLLENVHKLSQQGTLSDQHIVQIKDNSANCLKVLQRCESLADKFPATPVGHSSLKAKWKRFHLDPGDVRAVRDQLTSCVSSLTALLTAIQSFQMNKISKGVDGIRNREADILFNTIADWFSSASFAKHQDYCLSSRLPGTGLWAVKDPKYKQWENGDVNTLLCPGIPGSGKSVLHATLVDDLRNRYEHDDTVVVVYFYCSFQRQAEQTAGNILSVLIRQMFQECHRLPLEVKALYDKHYPRKTRPSVNELEQLLHSLLTGYRKVFILIDAMDECMSYEGDCIEFLDKLLNLQRSKSAMKLLVTTRWLPHITEHFGACSQLEIRAHQEDIERYLDHSIHRLPIKPHVKIKLDNNMVTVQDAVKSRIIDAADGMFLLARLQFDSLTDKTNPRKLQQALLQLHGGLEALESEYDKALVRIDQQREGFREIAYKVLGWIVYAEKELSIVELREAVAIYEGMEDVDHETDLEEEQQLASVCAGLVRIDHEARVMRLVHYTTQEYLKNALPKRNEGEVSIARDCLTYLSMNVFKQTWTAQDLFKKYELFGYAMNHWGKHIKPEFEQDLIPYVDRLLFAPELFQTATRFLLKGRPSLRLGSNASSSTVYRYNLSPAHICTYFDMALTISRVIDQKEDIDGRDSMGKTPLSWAAEYGRVEVTRVLLERSDVSVNTRDNRKRTPLSMAILNGHINIVELLLRRADIDINSVNEHGEMPLHQAVSQGHTAIVKLLLQQKGVKVETHRTGETILRTAVHRGDCDMIKLLMGRPELSVDQYASKPESTTRGNTDKFKLIRDAVEIRRSVEILRILMEHAYIRDDPSAFDEAELLHSAAVRGTAEIMEYLLSSTKGSPNAEDSHGRTVLHMAVRDRRSEIAKVLLEHPDVNPDSSDHHGRTPLSYASQFGCDRVAQVLLQRSDVNPDSSDNDGRTPLSWAAECGSLETGKALLQRLDVNPDSSDHDGRTPLSYAIKFDFTEIAQILLQRSDVNPDTKDHDGRTPLSYAAQYGSLKMAEVVEELLQRSEVDCDSIDHRGRTPLSYAAEHGSQLVVELLLQRSSKINPNSSDHRGRTPLSYAAAAARYTSWILQSLLEQPTVRPDSKDHQGRTPLSYAAEAGSSDIVEAFLAIPQVDMNARDDIGLTPFLWSLKNDDVAVAGVFLEQWLASSDSAEAFSTLALNAIQNICRAEKIDSTQSRKVVDFLGKCLLFLGYRDWAFFAFQRCVTVQPDRPSGVHVMISCDGCEECPISGERFVCRGCVDRDLCATCMEKQTNGKGLEYCANHEFLHVPCQKNPSEDLSKSYQVIESLQDLKLASQDQSQVDPNLAVSTEWRVGVEERYRYWGFFSRLS